MRRFAILMIAVGLASACAKSPAEQTILQEGDLQSTGGSFDASSIVDLASFTDDQTLDASAVQAFLERTPYDRGSFLATYRSNGLLASDAIARVANRYKLNPLVFLVRAQMDGGLVGAEFYPVPSRRVEYAFGCGCAASDGTDCDAALAGFDVQVECLGQTLRASLDAIAKNGQTSAAWGPGLSSVTLDGVAVTPADASTAALYQETPLVNFEKPGGTWLFWNLWQSYAAAIHYFGGFSPSP